MAWVFPNIPFMIIQNLLVDLINPSIKKKPGQIKLFQGF